MPSLVEIGPVLLEKKLKIGKVYRQTDGQTDRRTDGQTDDGRQAIRKAHLSFQLRWAKNDKTSLLLVNQWKRNEYINTLNYSLSCNVIDICSIWRYSNNALIFIFRGGAFWWNNSCHCHFHYSTSAHWCCCVLLLSPQVTGIQWRKFFNS